MLATMRSQAATNPLIRAFGGVNGVNQEEDIQSTRERIRSCLFALLNPNVEVPYPKLIEINKGAVKLPQYDHLRGEGCKEVKDIPEPAPSLDELTFDPSMAYIPLIRRKPYKPKRKKGENDVGILEFVDSSKAIEGSSSDEGKKEMIDAKIICHEDDLNEGVSPVVEDTLKKRGRKKKRDSSDYH